MNNAPLDPEDLPQPAALDWDTVTEEVFPEDEVEPIDELDDDLDDADGDDDDDNPYGDSDAALPDDEEEAAIRRDPSRGDE